MSQMYLAGFPAKTVPEGISDVTTLPAPIITSEPILTLHKIVTLYPIYTLFPISTTPIFVYPLTYSVLVSCASIFTLLEMHTLSPTVMSHGNNESKA